MISPPYQKPKVLYADDSELVRKIMDTYSSKRKYKMIFADDGKTVFDTLAREEIDLVILDLQMKQVDGYAVVLALRRPELLEHEHILDAFLKDIGAEENYYHIKEHLGKVSKEIYEQIGDRYKETPILIFSTKAEHKEMLEKIGKIEFYPKPIPKEAPNVCKRINHLLDLK